MDSYIRINEGKESQDRTPYNEIYTAYRSFYKNILITRDTEVGEETYVPLTDEEDEIMSYFQTHKSHFIFVTGLKGIGKSTFLHSIKRKIEKSPCYEIIKIDLNAREKPFPTNNEIVTNVEEVENIIEKFLANYYFDLVADYFNIKQSSDNKHKFYCDLFNFMEKHNGHAFIADTTFIDNDEEKIAYIKNLRKSSNGYTLALTALKLLIYEMQQKFICENVSTCELSLNCMKNNRTKLLIILDNCDLKHIEYNKMFVKKLLHTIECVNNSDVQVGNIMIMMACRTNIYNIIKSNSSKNEVGAYTVKHIHIIKPCSLAVLLDKRYQRYIKEEHLSSIEDINFVKDNKTVTIEKRNSSIIKFTKYLSSDGQDEVLLSLCNNDLSIALDEVLKIFKNKYFIKVQDLIPAVIESSSKYDQFVGLRLSKILNALAYGNPISEEKMFYPATETILSNIFFWDPIYSESFLLQIRIIQFLLNLRVSEEIEKYGVDILRIVNMNNKYFINQKLYSGQEMEIRDSVLYCLNYMWAKELIHTNTMNKPESVYDRIFLMPKAEALYNLLSENSLLIEFFVDDTFVKKDAFDNYTFMRGSILNIEDRFIKLMKFVNFIIAAEENQIKAVVENNALKNFFNVFGNKLLSEHIFEGITKSYKSFYERHLYFYDSYKNTETRSTTMETDLENLYIKAQNRLTKFLNNLSNIM